jgi:hypothetical protein
MRRSRSNHFVRRSLWIALVIIVSAATAATVSTLLDVVRDEDPSASRTISGSRVSITDSLKDFPRTVSRYPGAGGWTRHDARRVAYFLVSLSQRP